MPSTSVKMSQRSAPRPAASATAVVSEPPRPSVVTSRVRLTPWNPATMTTRPAIQLLAHASARISSIRAPGVRLVRDDGRLRFPSG
jgi:hypothetical protein